MVEVIRGGITANVQTSSGAMPQRSSNHAVVVGNAPGWESTLVSFAKPRMKVDIVASNEAIESLGKRVCHAVSLHSEGDYLFSVSRNAKHVHTSTLHAGEHNGMFKWVTDYEYGYPPDSGVFSMLVAYLLGYETITLCGVCLDSGTWFSRGQDHFKRLIQRMPDVTVRSLSGWTKEYLEDAGAC